ncbi:MAG: hypothetical protein BGO67_05185 [Alphaproteobacteria bacterium 41-28]|nr:MAG: hypothetical protein BGO67_05185 [Alphaproteobacteria bacterium 41-28]
MSHQNCKKCHSPNFVKSGHTRGHKRYKCKERGCQFTSAPCIEMLEVNAIQISMDGKRRCMDNIYAERLWRSLKYGVSREGWFVQRELVLPG